MSDQEREAARSRTDAKLRYAAIHLAELKATLRRGDEFDRAHQESFLFHLHGARDAFLQELNVRHACGLALNRVRRDNLEQVMKARGKASPALERLAALEKDLDSWLSCVTEVRDHSTHRHAVPRVFQVGGEEDGQVYLTDTRSGKALEQDYSIVFEDWLTSMENLIGELRLLDEQQS